jgi:hypothetical protein
MVFQTGLDLASNTFFVGVETIRGIALLEGVLYSSGVEGGVGYASVSIDEKGVGIPSELREHAQ